MERGGHLRRRGGVEGEEEEEGQDDKEDENIRSTIRYDIQKESQESKGWERQLNIDLSLNDSADKVARHFLNTTEGEM